MSHPSRVLAWRSSVARALRDLRERARRHPGFASAVVTSYGQIAASMAVQLLMMPLYLAHLDAYRFGVFMMLLTTVNVAALGIGWISGGMQRLFGEAFARSDETGFNLVYAVSKWLFLAYGTFAAAMILTGAVLTPALGWGPPPQYRTSVLAGVLGLGVYLNLLYSFNVDRVALTSRGHQALANILSIASQAVFVVLAIPTLFVGGGLGALMLCFGAGAGLSLLLSRLFWRRLGLRPSWWVGFRKEHKAVGKRLAGRMGAGFFWVGMMTLALQSDPLIVGLVAGPEVVARFVLVWRLAEMTALALWRLPDALVPFIVHMEIRGDAAELRSTHRLLLTAMTLAGAVFGALYAGFGQKIVSVWVGASKAPNDTFAYILAGTMVFWLCLVRAPIAFAYALARLRPLGYLLTAEVALKETLMVLLLPAFSYKAPLIAWNLVHVGGLAWVYLLMGRKSVHPLSSHFQHGQASPAKP